MNRVTELQLRKAHWYSSSSLTYPVPLLCSLSSVSLRELKRLLEDVSHLIFMRHYLGRSRIAILNWIMRSRYYSFLWFRFLYRMSLKSMVRPLTCNPTRTSGKRENERGSTHGINLWIAILVLSVSSQYAYTAPMRVWLDEVGPLLLRIPLHLDAEAKVQNFTLHLTLFTLSYRANQMNLRQ